MLVNAARADTPAAVVIPLDASFAARLRLPPVCGGLLRADRVAVHPIVLPSTNVEGSRSRCGRLMGASPAKRIETSRGACSAAARVPAGPAWKTHDLRDRTIRLVRTGLDLMRGGYLDLLR